VLVTDDLFRNIFTVMTPRQQREHRDHVIVIMSGACMSTSNSNVDFLTHPGKQAFINSRIQP
jgi:hypothetical protein